MTAVVMLPDITVIVAMGSHKFNVTRWIRLIVATCTPVDKTLATGRRRRTVHAELEGLEGLAEPVQET